jgi:hypothetical protein
MAAAMPTAEVRPEVNTPAAVSQMITPGAFHSIESRFIIIKNIPVQIAGTALRYF